MISAIVLAAGKSSRMGKLKLLLPIAGRSIIRAVVENVLRSKADEVVVVLGNQAPRVRREIESVESELAAGNTRLRIVENPRFEDGQSSSLKVGLSSVDGRCEGALVLMGDQPFVGPDIIDALIDGFRAAGALVAVPHYLEGRASPVLFARDLFPELMGVTGDKGGRDVAAKYLETEGTRRACIVEVRSSLAGRDVDTWEDYQELAGKGAV